MTYSRRMAPEEKLVVVNFRTKNTFPALNEWRERNAVAVAESCARQVWFGTAETFADFPRTDRPGINILHGADAYAFLVKLMTGMDSPKKGETNIKGQFFAQWDAFKEQEPQAGKELEPVLQHLKADSRSIQNQILSGHKMHEHGLAARDLSGLKKGATVLLVGHLSRHGNIGEYGEKVVRSINNRSHQAERIIVTHPDRKVAKQIMAELKLLKDKKIIRCPVEEVSFEDLPIAMELADYSFVDMPMGENTSADEYIINVWQSRENKENTLIHMRGNPACRGYSDPIWEEAGLDNYISPEDIRREMFERGRFNKELSEIAELAFTHCGEVRLAGGCLSDRKMRDFVKAHRQGLSIATPSEEATGPSIPQPR